MVLVDRTLPSRDLGELLGLARLEDARFDIKKIFEKILKTSPVSDRDILIKVHEFQRVRGLFSFKEQMEVHKAYQKWWQVRKAYAEIVEREILPDNSLLGIVKELVLSIGDLFSDEREKLHKGRVAYFEAADKIKEDRKKAVELFPKFFKTENPLKTLKEVRACLDRMDKVCGSNKRYNRFLTRYMNQVKRESHWPPLDYVFKQAITPPERPKRPPLLRGYRNSLYRVRRRRPYRIQPPTFLLSLEEAREASIREKGKRKRCN